jgi:hypothetical protein
MYGPGTVLSRNLLPNLPAQPASPWRVPGPPSHFRARLIGPPPIRRIPHWLWSHNVVPARASHHLLLAGHRSQGCCSGNVRQLYHSIGSFVKSYLTLCNNFCNGLEAHPWYHPATSGQSTPLRFPSSRGRLSQRRGCATVRTSWSPPTGNGQVSTDPSQLSRKSGDNRLQCLTNSARIGTFRSLIVALGGARVRTRVLRCPRDCLG